MNLNLSASRILLLCSVVVFALAAFGVELGTFHMVPMGLALLAASMFLP